MIVDLLTTCPSGKVFAHYTQKSRCKHPCTWSMINMLPFFTS
jgi:hypothetical protein